MKITNPPSEVYPPGDTIREELAERGWTQDDLAKIMGKSPRAINQVVCGKAAITPETAQQLAGAFGTSAEFWERREAYYRRALSPVNVDEIKDRARLFSIAPVKTMEKRGWITKTKSIAELESVLKEFFKCDDLDGPIPLPLAARTSELKGQDTAAAQLAWCYRALHMASAIPVEKYSEKRLRAGIIELRELATHADTARLVPRVLAKMGIRFVIIQHLPKSKIDGAAIWLEHRSPIIAMSLRYGRIDYFWHTLMHELSHVLHRDQYTIDIDMYSNESSERIDAIERRANDEAANWLIPREKLDSFIQRVSPLYSKSRIERFANRNNIHPGIVAGHLHFRGEVDWAAHRQMLTDVRSVVTQEALTDGWGFTIGQ